MVGSNRSRATGIWAWAISLGLHGLLLGGFAMVGVPTGTRDIPEGTGAAALVETVSRMIEAEPIVPKPTLVPIQTTGPEPSISDRIMPEVPTALLGSERIEDFSADLLGWPGDFFGGSLAAERICFVTDCSGSMFGWMGLVRAQLRQAVENLAPNQFFSTLFFHEGNVILESGSGSLVRASADSRQKAIDLIESILPEGPTAALPALRRAMELKTPAGHGVELIYFLTDGFDLDETGAAGFIREVLALRKKLAPESVIHTIGFWADPEGRQILEILAAQTGGIFIPVDSAEEE